MARSAYRRFAAKLLADGFVFKNSQKLGLYVINKTGLSIAADKVVAVTGFDVTSKRPKIVLADADLATHTDLWVTQSAVADGAKTFVYKGNVSAANLNTNSVTTVGDPVYLSGTAGAFTVTADFTTNVVPVGYVLVKSATVGQIFWDVSMGTVGSAMQSFPVTANIIAGAAGGDYDGRLFIADRAYQVTAVREQHQTAGNDAGAVTLQVAKVPSGTAKSAGTSILTAGFNLKAVADTVQSGTLSATGSDYTLAAGDSLGLVLTGTPTAVDGVTVTVWLKKV